MGSIVVIVRECTVNSFKILLRCATQRAHPICGQILEIGAFLDSVIGISYLGTVLITAQLASIYAHSFLSFHMVIMIFRSFKGALQKISVVYNIATQAFCQEDNSFFLKFSFAANSPKG